MMISSDELDEWRLDHIDELFQANRPHFASDCRFCRMAELIEALRVNMVIYETMAMQSGIDLANENAG